MIMMNYHLLYIQEYIIQFVKESEIFSDKKSYHVSSHQLLGDKFILTKNNVLSP